MFSSVKVPRNLCEYRLFRGAADFGNLRQWDLYEKGYSFLTVVTVPKFIHTLATTGVSKDTKIKPIAARLLNNFVYILEHEFRGLTGLANITAETSEITDGISSVALINKVTEDTSITVQMSFFEKSGRTITKFCELYLRGIKDTRTQGKTYFGLIEEGTLEAGFQNEVFSLLYYVTDNTYRHLEGAYLLMCAQITEVPLTEVFESEKGSYSYPEISVSFNCFPVTDDEVNEEAAKLLEYLLSDNAGDDKLIVDTQTTTGFYSGIDDLKSPYGLKAVASTGEYASDTATTSYTSGSSASTYGGYDWTQTQNGDAVTSTATSSNTKSKSKSK
jgi:hypothetical protein